MPPLHDRAIRDAAFPAALRPPRLPPRNPGAPRRPRDLGKWLGWLALAGAAFFAPGPASAESPAPPTITIHSTLQEPVFTAGDHADGIIFSAQAHWETARFSWEINKSKLPDLPPKFGRVHGSPRQGIIIYTPPADLSGPAIALSIVAIAKVGSREIRSEPFRLAVQPARRPRAISMIRTRSETIAPSCKTILANLNDRLSEYRELLKKERGNQTGNEEIIAVLTEIRTLSERAKNCTGYDLDLLDKLQLNLVNRLSILIKDKARDLWARYDGLVDRLRTAPPENAPALLRQIFELQMQIKAMHEQYNMDMSQKIVERLQEDGEMIRRALNAPSSEPPPLSP